MASSGDQKKRSAMSALPSIHGSQKKKQKKDCEPLHLISEEPIGLEVEGVVLGHQKVVPLNIYIETNLVEKWAAPSHNWSCQNNELPSNLVLRRLGPKSSILIQELICLVLEHHEKGKFHGRLWDPSYYLVTERGSGKFTVYLKPNHPGDADYASDMKDFIQMLTNEFLGFGELPKDIEHLLSLLRIYGVGTWDREANVVLKNHIALWSSAKKRLYWTEFQNALMNRASEHYVELQSAVEQIPTHLRADGAWKNHIPPSEPFESMLNHDYGAKKKYGASYGATIKTLFRYIWNVDTHAHDWTKGHKIGGFRLKRGLKFSTRLKGLNISNGLKGFKIINGKNGLQICDGKNGGHTKTKKISKGKISEQYFYYQDHMKDRRSNNFLSKDFIEAVMSESFSDFLLPPFNHLARRGIFLV